MKKFDLQNILFNLIFASSIYATPPRHVPEEYLDAYTQNRAIPVYDLYFDNTQATDGCQFYQPEAVELLINKAKKRETNYYGITDSWLFRLLDKNPGLIKGKKVAIVGSIIPWYEAIVLAYGGFPTTVEYNFIEMQDSRLNYLSVNQLIQSDEKFDVVISISSFEHDGLGRYGDQLNPNGDLEAMKLWKNHLKDDGVMILSVPVGEDALVWNAHRIYGPLRFFNLIDEYEIIQSEPKLERIRKEFFKLQPKNFVQPIFLLKKKS